MNYPGGPQSARIGTSKRLKGSDALYDRLEEGGAPPTGIGVATEPCCGVAVHPGGGYGVASWNDPMLGVPPGENVRG